jgi:hypothetical protein
MFQLAGFVEGIVVEDWEDDDSFVEVVNPPLPAVFDDDDAVDGSLTLEERAARTLAGARAARLEATADFWNAQPAPPPLRRARKPRARVPACCRHRAKGAHRQPAACEVSAPRQ